jgi:mono/diheme cytochrome c family protein
MTRIRLSVIIAALLVPALLAPIAAEKQAKVVTKPATRTDMSSGKEMYSEYCASCHGADGHGSARTAAALKATIPDLASIRKRHHTTDVSTFVRNVLREDKLPGHQAKGMPDWRPILFRVSGGNEDQATLRQTNLGKYVESLQGK